MKTHSLIFALLCLLPACRKDDGTFVISSRPLGEPVEKIPETVTFNEHIQPILSEYCYHCHGPDSGTREPKDAPLRLDIEENAFAARENGKPVIIKGDPEASLLMKLIHSKDQEEIMPPPASHKVLGEKEIALIERWIEQGAEYQDHWAFIPPVKAEISKGSASENPIDHFIGEKLAAQNLTPNPRENPLRFYRRLHFDLTGLPPSPEKAAEFAHAAETGWSAAVSNAADELLASPPAAEHQAKIWLDAARYADTHGIHIDNYRSIWPYRDWVIRAFQKNQPWDEFTIEQIAGDLLPEPNLDQKIATGFNRCLPTTGEGGAIAEEYQAIYAKDQVETVSAVWLGLTTGCAACHDHKFDPVSTADFYALTAFFRNTTMNAMDGNNADHPPVVFAPIPEDRDRWAALEADIKNVQTTLATRKTEAGADFTAWLADPKADDASADLDSSLTLHLPFTDAAKPVQGFADGKPVQWEIPAERREGPLGNAILANSVSADLGDLGAFSRTDQVTFGGYIYVEGAPNGAIIARMDANQKHRGWDLWLENGKIGSHIIDQWPDAANKIVSNKPLEPGKWHHVMVVFNGSQASHQTMSLFIDGKPAATKMAANTLGADISTAVPLRLGSRSGGANRLSGVVGLQDFRFYRRALKAEEVALISSRSQLKTFLAIPTEQRTPAQTEFLLNHFVTTADAPSLALSQKLDQFLQEQNVLKSRGSNTLIMQERENEEAHAFVLERGIYSAKGNRLVANVPAVLPPMPPDAPKNRLGLAKWLVDRANPLTARVTVNRAWIQFFGEGLVESASDFGIMGSRPSHPKLLDWLAVEFMESGWDYRHVLKQIVTSATYQQSGVVTAEKLEKDPYNRLLSRGPRHRLDAESLRDFALSASGLLSPTIGGAPVKPYQPTGIWEAVAMPQSNTRAYKEDTGEGLYRRSIYTFWKRTAPPPSMEILNASPREVTCVRRERTNTPLQALVLQNDPQFVEASRELASRALKSSPETNVRLDYIAARLLSRNLRPDEREIVTANLKKFLSTYAADPENAAALIAVGATKPDASLAAPELAAWSLIASQILNLDETLTR